MARKRAVDKSQTVDVKGRLPLLYTSLTPLTPEQHASLRIAKTRSFDFAAKATAIPITMDEFSQAMRDYPIVFSTGGAPIPLALVGLRNGVNDHVQPDGTWSPRSYVPAYLRRYPFLLVKQDAASQRQILCADLSSMMFGSDQEATNPLFTETGTQSQQLSDILDFATRYETSAQRTNEVMAEIVELGLLQPSTVNVSKGEKTARIEGFAVIAEDKMRALDDATLARLARRGVMGLFSAHHMSLANFSQMGALA